MLRLCFAPCPIVLILAFLAFVPPVQAREATPWYDGQWPFRMLITVEPDSVQGTAALADFPLLLVLSQTQGDAVFDEAKLDGSDLLFTASDGVTPLSREVVSFDPVSRSAEIWVRMPQLSKTDNELYVYYGNPAADLPPVEPQSWDSAYRAVYHFEEDPGDGVLIDSGPHEAHAALVGSRGWTSSDVGIGQVGQSWIFNGTTHHVSTRALSTQDSSYVLSGWLMNTANNVDFFMQANPGFWHVSSQVNTNNPQPDLAGGGLFVRWEPDPIPIGDGYHHFLWVFDGVQDTVEFYFDGEPQQIGHQFPFDLEAIYTGRQINPDNGEPVGILGPMYFNNQDLMTGGADEYRVREGVVSGDWVGTEYRNQRYPLAFLDFGVEEQEGVTAAGPFSPTVISSIRAYPNPFRERTAIQFHLRSQSPVEVVVYDVAGREVKRILDGTLGQGEHVLHWNRRTRTGSPAAAGVYYVNIRLPHGSSSLKTILLN